jgi:hypothetical protein
MKKVDNRQSRKDLVSHVRGFDLYKMPLRVKFIPTILLHFEHIFVTAFIKLLFGYLFTCLFH